MQRKALIFLLLTVVSMVSMNRCFAQESTMVEESVKIYFDQSYTKKYKEISHDESLRSFADAINKHRENGYRIDKVSVVASTSPEGYISVNERIATSRAQTMTKLLNSYLAEPVECTVSICFDWELLTHLVEERDDVPNKSEILDILYNTHEDALDPTGRYSSRYRKIVALNYGVPYVWLLENLFPELRYAKAVVEMSPIPPPEPPAPKISEEWLASQQATIAAMTKLATEVQQAAKAAEPVTEEPQTIDTTSSVEHRGFNMAIKSNALYLLAATPNIGAEISLGKGWSIAANWEYAWWHSDNVSWYHRVYGGDLAVRKWFGKQSKERPLSGHHIGIYGQLVTYDVMWGSSLSGQLTDKWNYGAGIEYGYSLPVTERFNIDFSIGVGYLTGLVKTYERQEDCYVWMQTRKRRYIGPTNLGISLVWTIGGKGGGR